MEKKLDIGERLAAMALLPKAGNYGELRILNELIHKLGPSAEEWKEFGMYREGQTIHWEPGGKGTEFRPLELKERECDIIAEQLRQKDRDKTLEMQHFTLYDKFVENKEEIKDKGAKT